MAGNVTTRRSLAQQRFYRTLFKERIKLYPLDEAVIRRIQNVGKYLHSDKPYDL